MKPDDRNGKLPPAKRPFRVLLIAGSDRRQYNCPGVDSKARTLMLRMADRLPKEWEIARRTHNSSSCVTPAPGGAN